jgi:glycosyltransferase involved in cell wall biosynthesis
MLTDQSDVVIKCINGKFALPLVFAACRARQRPFILWTGSWSVLDSIANRLVERFNLYVCRRADAVVTYGDHVTRYLIERGVSPVNIFTSKHAVSNSLYSRPVTPEEIESLRSRLAVPRGARIVLYVGRLVAQKGLNYLIQGFAEAGKSRNTCLVIVGTGPERQACEELARTLGVIERVRFPGYVSPQDTVAYYAAAYAFVLSSITWHGWKETWGLVINEAFNQGVPVVSTDAVGAAAGGLVLDGENGIVVPERNSEAIAVALGRLLDDPELRHRLSVNARSRIAMWDQPDMVRAFSGAIEYVVRKRLNGQVG